MPKIRPFRKLSIDEDLCRSLEQRKALERRQGSLTEYVSEILDWYIQGLLVRPELAEEEGRGLITAAKIDQKTVASERAKTG